MVTLELLVVLVLILMNGFLAMSEMAIVSSRKVRLQQRADDGDAGAAAALALAEHPNQILSAVQIGITLISLLAGAFSGATVADVLAGQLASIPGLAAYSKALAVGVVVLGVGYVSLVLGELAPKRIALNNAETIAASVARPMRVIAWIAHPAVRLLGFSTEAVLRLLRVRPSAEPSVTEEEINLMAQEAAASGVIEPAEQQLVQRVFHLGDRRVEELMTPRPRIIWLDLNESTELNLRKIKTSGHSYFPVCKGSLDKLLGLASIKLLLAQVADGKPSDLQAAMIHALLVPERTRALALLDLFKQTRKHLAMVIDEYGTVKGLVTVIDVMEALVGDLPDHEQPAVPEAVRREDGSWLVDGMMSIPEFKERLAIEELPGEDIRYYQSVGGMLIHHFGHIPKAGEVFSWQGLRFEVLDMDGHRVDKVLVTPPPQQDAPV